MRIFKITSFVISALLFCTNIMFAQWGNFNHLQGRLAIVQLQGTVVDTQSRNGVTLYLLDINSNAEPDYLLSFGPDWYQPTSEASRPEIDDQIEISGKLVDSHDPPLVVVYEINGQSWRPCYEDDWQITWPKPLNKVSLTGTVLVDENDSYPVYFLDVNDDGLADYYLDFGPPEYSPSDLVRPEAGAKVNIIGGVDESVSPPRVLVYMINDHEWRDSDGPAPWRGRWISKQWPDSLIVPCLPDSRSYLIVPPGAMAGRGQDFPDSLFCEFWRIVPDSLPNLPDSVIVGFKLLFAGPRTSKVGGHDERGVKFFKPLFMNFSYDLNDGLLKPTARKISLWAWDETNKNWNQYEGATTNDQQKSVSTSTDVVAPYYAVTSVSAHSSVSQKKSLTTERFSLSQNHPNPFNPSTVIFYTLNNAEKRLTQLVVYDLLGRTVKTLVSAPQLSGEHHVKWDGVDESGHEMPPGIYFYRLSSGEFVQTRRMILIK